MLVDQGGYRVEFRAIVTSSLLQDNRIQLELSHPVLAPDMHVRRLVAIK
jgi:hypothetical protein